MTAAGGTGEKDVTLTVAVQDATNALVQPYPFDSNPLVVSFPGRLVANRPYKSQEEFLADFYKADRVMITYYLHGQ